jgi:hypothetical protein
MIVVKHSIAGRFPRKTAETIGKQALFSKSQRIF